MGRMAEDEIVAAGRKAAWEGCDGWARLRRVVPAKPCRSDAASNTEANLATSCPALQSILIRNLTRSTNASCTPKCACPRGNFGSMTDGVVLAAVVRPMVSPNGPA